MSTAKPCWNVSDCTKSTRNVEKGGASAPLCCTFKGNEPRKWFTFLGKSNGGGGGIATTGVVLDKKLELVLALLMPGNALVARVMLCTGLRVGDVLALTREQIKPSVRVLSG